MKTYRVELVETVRYWVEVEAEDEDLACENAVEAWVNSEDPTDDFRGQGEGVEVEGVEVIATETKES